MIICTLLHSLSKHECSTRWISYIIMVETFCTFFCSCVNLLDSKPFNFQLLKNFACYSGVVWLVVWVPLFPRKKYIFQEKKCDEANHGRKLAGATMNRILILKWKFSLSKDCIHIIYIMCVYILCTLLTKDPFAFVSRNKSSVWNCVSV